MARQEIQTQFSGFFSYCCTCAVRSSEWAVFGFRHKLIRNCLIRVSLVSHRQGGPLCTYLCTQWLAPPQNPCDKPKQVAVDLKSIVAIAQEEMSITHLQLYDTSILHLMVHSKDTTNFVAIDTFD